MNVKEVWYLFLKEVQKCYQLSKTGFISYIAVLEPICIKDNTLIISGPNLFTINIVSRRYEDLFRDALKKVAPELNFLLIPPEDVDKYEISTDTYTPVIDESLPNLEPKFTFENFIVGSSNAYAHATGFAIAQNPGKVFNPFFIYGKSGLGKTHLMHAIAHYLLENHKDLKIWYLSAEQFTNEMIHAIKTNSNEKFRAKYRNLDCLFVDDIQFLENKEAVQEEFFHTFNSLIMNEAQIVIASDRLPKEIKTLNDRLITRFEQGVVADVKMPDLETRIAILEKLDAFEKYNIPPNIIKEVANSVDTSIRELEGALRRVNAYSVLNKTKPNSEIVRLVLKQMMIDKEKNQKIDPMKIISKVADNFNVSVDDIVGRKKTMEVTVARHIAMYITRELTDLSYPNIGYTFGRDHSSVIYACDKVKELTRSDQSLKKRINSIIREVRK